MPGGLLSICVKILFLLYLILKLKQMILYENWNLTQQKIQQSDDELTKIHNFTDHPNVTLGLQFK